MGETIIAGTAASGGTSYATLAELRGDLNLGAGDTADDDRLTEILADASRAIDNETNRFFYQLLGTRYYDTERPGRVWIDDLVSLTSLTTDDDGDGTCEQVWAATDYILRPTNAPAGAEPEPYQYIETRSNGLYTFPSIEAGVQVVGVFGWPAAPGPVRRVCLRLAGRMFALPRAPLGIQGGGEFATMILRNDPDMRRWLEKYVE